MLSFDMKARHNARKNLIQAIYQWQLTQEDVREIEQQFLDSFLGKRVEFPYFQAILHEIPIQIKKIDAAFSPHLSRPLRDVDPIELAVLRLATFELLFRIDIPYQVIINEALELTKVFGTQEGFKFINSILDKTAQNIRTEECKFHRKLL